MSRLYPKWVKPDRQAYLVDLWTLYGNRCLHGHQACPIREHYLYTESVGVKIGVPVKIPCEDRNGNPIRDRDGNRLYLTVYKAKTVSVPETRIARLYELKSETAIQSWIAEDKAQEQAEWLTERKALHSLGERRYPVRGRFNTIGKDIYFSHQPWFYLEGLGISGLTLKPFAKVRLASSFVHLHVDLGDTLRQVSKCKRRKAIRYGKALPKQVDNQVHELCKAAVGHYLK